MDAVVKEYFEGAGCLLKGAANRRQLAGDTCLGRWALASWPAAIQGKGCARLGHLERAEAAAVGKLLCCWQNVILPRGVIAAYRRAMGAWGACLPPQIEFASWMHLQECGHGQGWVGQQRKPSCMNPTAQLQCRHRASVSGRHSAGSKAAPSPRPGTGSHVVGQAVGAEADQALAGVHAAASHAVCSERQESGRAPSCMEARIGARRASQARHGYLRLARLGRQRHADGADESPPPFPLSSATHWALCRSHSRPACTRADRQCECASARKPRSEHQSYAAFCCRDVTISWVQVHASTPPKARD